MDALFVSPLHGFQVVEDWHMTHYVRRPRLPASKSKRIRNKWRKKYPQGVTLPKDEVYRLGNMIIGHPLTIAKLCREIESGTRGTDARN